MKNKELEIATSELLNTIDMINQSTMCMEES